mmetsp:Transcript_65355/g.174154  ORF Transcript_65355/g.174154 Transcript_65355/m.174154 type:complete len:233 (-) Transcript_65355:40-738(-)
MFRGFLGAAGPLGTQPAFQGLPSDGSAGSSYPTFLGPVQQGTEATPQPLAAPQALAPRPVAAPVEHAWTPGQTASHQQNGLQVHRQNVHEQFSQGTTANPNGWQSLVRHEVQQQLAASVPPASYGSQQPPVQLLINNTSTSNADQKTVNMSPPAERSPEPRRPESLSLREQLALFWASPVNRICTMGVLGLALYIYHDSTQHRWRMQELQRRIDNNLFLWAVQRAMGPSSAR